jgi:hypothetical protein
MCGKFATKSLRKILKSSPWAFRAADVLSKAYSLRVERGDHHITEEHLADAIELLLATRRRMPIQEKMPVSAQ